MAKLERVYNIPLRKEFMKVPSHRKAKKSVVATKEFLARHFRVDFENVKLGSSVNDDIWKHGMKNPPHHIKVNAVLEDGIVKAELVGAEAKKEKPAKEKKPKAEKKSEAPKAEHKHEDHAGHKHEEKKEAPKEHKKEEKPKTEKKPEHKKE